MKDILNNTSLKARPYSVPDGYFEGVRKSLASRDVTADRKSPAYTAIAAAVALLLVAAGGYILGMSSETDLSQEDYIVFSDEMTNTIFYEDEYIYADAVSEEDIIEYLIYTETELEELY